MKNIIALIDVKNLNFCPGGKPILFMKISRMKYRIHQLEKL